MRIDKYLWCIRVFKTRSISSEYCRAGKVSINEEAIKPSKEVKQNDLIVIRKGSIQFSYKVKEIPKNRVGAKLVEEYAIDCTSPIELEKLKMLLLAQKEDRWKGLGRPTKKDRRDIDKFLE
jgi:ribosome-associated heat shock protein Hsp15